MWPYPIEYHSTTELAARPSLVYIDPPASEGGAALVDARARAAFVAQAPARAAARRAVEADADAEDAAEGGGELATSPPARGRVPGLWTGGGAALSLQRRREDGDLEALAHLALRVIYVDADLLVVDKPAGLLSVPGVYSRFSVASAAAHVLGLERTDMMVYVHAKKSRASQRGLLLLLPAPAALGAMRFF
jgi:hypothetical protein